MKIIKKVLDSGLTVILAPMPGVKTIMGIFSVRAGWKYETPENDGVAHFLEHMFFKGTKKRPTAFEIIKEIDSKGGEFNATTSEEITNYYIHLPSEFTEMVCDILSDILLNSIFDSGEIGKEKGVIIQELHMCQDDPCDYCYQIAWPRLLYGDHPAGKSGVGTDESIKNMSQSNFLEFIENLYTCENAAFCLAGKITDKEKLLMLVDNFFSRVRAGKPKIKKFSVIENQQQPALFFESRDIKQSNFVLGVRAYPFIHPKRRALQLLNVILGGNTSSRLWLEIREKRGLAYSVGSFFDSQSDLGNFGMYAGVSPEKISATITVILNECKKMCDEEVSEEELQRAKDYIIYSAQMGFISPVLVARYLTRQWAIKGEIAPFEAEAKKVQAVTAEDIQSVAQEIFVNKGLNLAIVGPHAGMEEEFLKIMKF